MRTSCGIKIETNHVIMYMCVLELLSCFTDMNILTSAMMDLCQIESHRIKDVDVRCRDVIIEIEKAFPSIWLWQIECACACVPAHIWVRFMISKQFRETLPAGNQNALPTKTVSVKLYRNTLCCWSRWAADCLWVRLLNQWWSERGNMSRWNGERATFFEERESLFGQSSTHGKTRQNRAQNHHLSISGQTSAFTTHARTLARRQATADKRLEHPVEMHINQLLFQRIKVRSSDWCNSGFYRLKRTHDIPSVSSLTKEVTNLCGTSLFKNFILRRWEIFCSLFGNFEKEQILSAGLHNTSEKNPPRKPMMRYLPACCSSSSTTFPWLP